MARHVEQGAAQARVGSRLADFFLGEVEMHVDDLDHLPTEQSEVLLGHRLHGTNPPAASNGPGWLAFQASPRNALDLR